MDEKTKELCNTSLDYMDKLYPAIVNLYETLREYDLSEISTISDISKGLVWLSDAAKAIGSNFKLDFSEEVKNIYSQIKEIKIAMENNDYLFLADILEFDVVPSMEKIYNILRDI